ncbi:MAG: hypothetical protein OEU92_21310 [Alphaproteobacteria bacterium]|nr:hypothetical protein [Alphaproteobacteria bacterium]
MTRLVAIASKQVQLQELVACIQHFAVDHAQLHLFDHQGRVSRDGARATIEETCPKVRLDVASFDIGDRDVIGEIFAPEADIVAFPLYRSSAFYRKVPKLRRRSTVVHITDGVGDLFTMWQLQRAVIAKTPAALIKGALVIPQLYALRADLEFNLFHPQKTPYAKQSLPVGPFPMTRAKRQALHGLLQTKRPEALVIDGFDLTAARIAESLGLDSYVATRRDGGVDIDGRLYLQDDIICAEEVLALMRPALVAGCPSTSLAAARSLYTDLPVFCITTPEALRIRGPRFNAVFQDYAERFGIMFSGSSDVSGQFDDLRSLIPSQRRACA